MAVALLGCTDLGGSTTSITVPAGTNYMTICIDGIRWSSPAAAISSVVFNTSENASSLKSTTNSGAGGLYDVCAIWGLANPSITTANVVISFNQSMGAVRGQVQFWSGVDTATPLDGSYDNSGDGYTFCASPYNHNIVTSKANTMLLDFAYISGGSTTGYTGTGQATTGGSEDCSYRSTTSAGTYSMGRTGTWCNAGELVGIGLAAGAVGGAATSPSKMMTGLGL